MATVFHYNTERKKTHLFEVKEGKKSKRNCLTSTAQWIFLFAYVKINSPSSWYQIQSRRCHFKRKENGKELDIKR